MYGYETTSPIFIAPEKFGLLGAENNCPLGLDRRKLDTADTGGSTYNLHK